MRALLKGTKDKEFRQIIVPNELEVLQQLVDGYIEHVTIASDCVLLCNEDAVAMGLDFNCAFCGICFIGPILLAGVDGEEFTDCPWSVTMANKCIEL